MPNLDLNPPRTEEHRKVFRLAPVEDDLTSLILTARMETICNGQLSRSARLLYVLLLELAVRRSTNVDLGVVRVSDTKLADLLGTTRSSIARWKAELCEKGLIWVSSHFMPNTWPLSVYHLTALSRRDPHAAKTDDAGLWGNGQKRGPKPLSHFAAGGKKCPLPTQVPDLTPGRSHQRVPSGITSETGQDSPVRPGKTHQRDRARLTSETHKEVNSEQLKPSAAQAHLTGELRPGWVSTVSPVDEPLKGPVNPKVEGEKEFMELCRGVLGRKSQEEWGGYWRVLFRQDSGKAWRVMRAVREDLKTKEVRNPGGYARDLWNRFAPSDASKAAASEGGTTA